MSPDPQIMAEDIFKAALRAADPFASVVMQAGLIRERFVDGGYKRACYLAFGKAAPRMAEALESTCGDLLRQGIIITNHADAGRFGSRLGEPACVMGAGHPLPDKAGLEATGEAMKMVRGLGRDDLLVCLISGGGSAMLTYPLEGIAHERMQSITGALLRSGADIDEMNTVRRHISEVKGGKLARLAHPAGVISLIVSDVVGDRLETIASGPTAPDPTTSDDALAILSRYAIESPEVLQAMGTADAETLKPGDPVFERVSNILCATNSDALKAALGKAIELGLRPEILTEELTGDVQEAASWLAQKAMEPRTLPACLISGGETTVRVSGDGTGGRNMELALRFALEAADLKRFTLLSAATDGSDGPTDAAGAIVDNHTIRHAIKNGLDPEDYLRRNDSYNFFSQTKGLVITGSTGTNVMDVQIMVLD